jgi:bifunctional oligoribonuclease and PAP phosphatase NrnA
LAVETATVTQDDLRAAADALRSARRVTAFCHENPDADTIGAAVAVCLLAERLGAQAEIVSADGIPDLYGFLPQIERVRRRPALEPDLAVVCDAATLGRVGRIAEEEADWFSGARLLNIDHHASSSRFGDLNLVDPSAAATCEVLSSLVDELGVQLDAELATALLTGIVRDTQGFSDHSTSADTLRIAARLVDAGAPLAEIHRHILGELSYPTMALWGKMLAGIRQAAGGRIIYATVTRQMLEETGTQQHDADGLVEFLARAQGADITLLLREVGPSETRVSIRATQAADAMGIAARFGGGGHARRAGGTFPLFIDDALALLLTAAEATLKA